MQRLGADPWADVPQRYVLRQGDTAEHDLTGEVSPESFHARRGGSGGGVQELVAERVGDLFDLPVPGAELVQALCHGLGGDPVRR